MGIHKRKDGAVDKWRETQGRAGTRLKAAPQGQTVNRSLIRMKPDSPSAVKAAALLSEQAHRSHRPQSSCGDSGTPGSAGEGVSQLRGLRPSAI